MTTVEIVQKSIEEEDITYEKASSGLENYYKSLSIEEKKFVDIAFTHLCGWELRTVIHTPDMVGGLE